MMKTKKIPTFLWRMIRVPPKLMYSLGLDRLQGKIVLLLTTTGRKSGKPHVVPLQYEEIDDAYFAASATGKNADWFRNICANPKVSVQVGDREFQGIAEPVTDPVKIADFLELRLERHPRMVGALMRGAGLPRKPDRHQLETYAANRAMVVIKPLVAGTIGKSYANGISIRPA